MMETAAQRYDYAFRQTVGYSANAIGESNACDFKATYQPELDRDKERLLKQWSRGQLIVDAVAQVPGLEQKLDDYWKFKHKSEYPDRYRLFDVAFYVEQEWLYPKGEHHHIRWISTLGPFWLSVYADIIRLNTILQFADMDILMAPYEALIKRMVEKEGYEQRIPESWKNRDQRARARSLLSK